MALLELFLCLKVCHSGWGKHMSTSNTQSRSGKKSNSGSGSSDAQAKLGDSATEAVDQVQDTVSGLGDQVKQQASNQLTSRLETAAGGLDMAVKLLRTAGDQVREQDKAGVADSLTGMADRAEAWSTSLREQDVDKLIQEAKQVAQRQPMLFVSGAVALGFLGARFLKSSSQPQDGSSSTGSENASGPGMASGSNSSGSAGGHVENTNPYPSFEENAALDASLNSPMTEDEILALDEATSPDADDSSQGTTGYSTSTGDR